MIERVGSSITLPVDLRIVSATHRDLPGEITTGRFRADLFYRLNIFPITLPPLRDRRSDIPILVEHFTKFFAAKHRRSLLRIDSNTLKELTAHDWQGNVRELQNIVERMVIASSGEIYHLDRNWLVRASPEETARTWSEQERTRILEALRAARGRIYGPGGAAQRLGLKPTTLYGKMRKHGIDRTDSDSGQ